MASFTADLATTGFLGLSFQSPNPVARVRTTIVPFLCSKTKPTQNYALSYSSSGRIAFDIAKPRRGTCRFTVAATATVTPQSEGSDVSTMIPLNNRIPATIITGFLGFGECILLKVIRFFSK